MPSFERVLTTFTRGELSPRIAGRIDFEGRFDGVELLQNFLVHVQGGAQKRSGTRFVEAAATATGVVRLIPFKVSVEQNYVIEATTGLFRFYTDEGRLVDGIGNPIEVVSTPYTDARLPTVKWTQSADVLFLAHGEVSPRELRRTSPTSFALASYNFIDGPYLDTNSTGTTLTLSGTGLGGITITASSTDGINDDQGFLTTDVGRRLRWRDPDGDWTWYRITARNSATQITADRAGGIPSDVTATTQWRLGAWSNTTGWPSVCQFHQGRLWWGRTRTQPQTLWSTEAGSVNSFAPTERDGTVTDANAITATLDSNQVNAIAWLVSSQRGLQVGTIGESWLLRSADSTTGLSPLSAEVIPQSTWGADDTVLPVRVGISTIYVQHGATIVRESAYSFDEDSYTDADISVLSEHLFRQGVLRLAFQQVPTQTVWALLANGTLAGFTFDKDQKVVAWHRHTVTGAQVMDITTMDTPHLGRHHEHLWIVARRTIDGQQVQYIEYMEAPFDATLDTIEEAFFVDSGLTGEFPGGTLTVSALDHLEGEEVAILADGATHPNRTVVGGSVSLDRTATVVHVGVPFSGEIRTMPLEAPSREGAFVSIGKTKRTHQVHVLLAETVGASIGPEHGVMDLVPFRKPVDPMDEAVPLFNGIKSVSLSSNHEVQSRVRVLSDQPLPCTVLAIAVETQIHAS